ncbi:HipA family kinase [Weissella paramesenteroides]|uniref:HipA family kinase n=1 Tax=Weissella paramesenteroides TaxID=1249 RepID=UPI003F74A894
MVVVERVIKQMNAGTTSPMLIEDSNHDKFVMKYIHNDWDGKFLFNELVSARIAQFLELPIPKFEIGILPKDIISENDGLMALNAKSGAVFLSQYRKGITLQNPKILKSATNIDDCGGIIFFDQLLNNIDRGQNEGNWFFDKATKRLMIFDHTHVFRVGQLWDKISLLQDQELPLKILENFSESLYRTLLNQINGKTPFYGITRKWSRMTDDNIATMLGDIPTEWNISNEDVEAIASFLHFQVEHATDIEGLLNTHLIWNGK